MKPIISAIYSQTTTIGLCLLLAGLVTVSIMLQDTSTLIKTLTTVISLIMIYAAVNLLAEKRKNQGYMEEDPRLTLVKNLALTAILALTATLTFV